LTALDGPNAQSGVDGYVWHGAQDTICDEASFRRVAALVPDSTFTVFEDAGHLAVAKNFDELLAAAVRPAEAS
jgi:hypothetical protein